MAPGGKTGMLSMAFSGKAYYRGSLHEVRRDKPVETMFLAKALEHFKGVGWENLAQKHLAELEAKTAK